MQAPREAPKAEQAPHSQPKEESKGGLEGCNGCDRSNCCRCGFDGTHSLSAHSGTSRSSWLQPSMEMVLASMASSLIRARDQCPAQASESKSSFWMASDNGPDDAASLW